MPEAFSGKLTSDEKGLSISKGVRVSDPHPNNLAPLTAPRLRYVSYRVCDLVLGVRQHKQVTLHTTHSHIHSPLKHIRPLTGPFGTPALNTFEPGPLP